MNINWDKVVTVEKKRAEQYAIDYNIWKGERAELVNLIVVEVNGNTYQGNEDAQSRLARAVASADDFESVVPWTMSDNSVVEVTYADLKEALRKSHQEQTAIWNEGRPVAADYGIEE